MRWTAAGGRLVGYRRNRGPVGTCSRVGRTRVRQFRCFGIQARPVPFPVACWLVRQSHKLPSGQCPPPPPGRVSREVRIGQAGRGRAQGGERPMGAAAYGGKGFKQGEG